MRILRIITTLLILLINWTTLRAQDGSDIIYGKIYQLDSSFIGNFAHLDFYHNSFGGRRVDSVTIDIGNRTLLFVEHRKDNGYNNWFNEQYLQTIGIMDGLTIRIVKARIDSITRDSIFVTNYLEYFDNKGHLIAIPGQVANGFPRDIIAEVLISEESR